MSREEAIVIQPIPTAINRIEYDQLYKAWSEGNTKLWRKLPRGYELRLLQNGRAFYVVILYQAQFLGYVLLTKQVINSSPTIKGWTVVRSYLSKDARGIGIMNQVYDAILDKGRMFAARIQTPMAKKFWMSKIKIDHRHRYVMFDAMSKQFTPVTKDTVDALEHNIWDGNANTTLVMMSAGDPALFRFGMTNK